MVAIVNYDREEAKKLSDFLSSRGIENKVSIDEIELSKADKIILPNYSNVKSVLRKLQLSNVFNLLKVVNKKILGINGGMILFCSYIKDAELSGLGVLEKVEVCGVTKCSFDSEIKIIGDEYELLKDCEKEKFHFEFKYYFAADKNTIAQIEYENKSISAALKKNNFYGILFSIKDSSNAGEKVIRNFLNLK